MDERLREILGDEDAWVVGGAVRDERESEAHVRLGLALRTAAATRAQRLLQMLHRGAGVIELERRHAECAVCGGGRAGVPLGAPERLGSQRARVLGIGHDHPVRLGRESGRLL